jgi:hypothetical protein
MSPQHLQGMRSVFAIGAACLFVGSLRADPAMPAHGTPIVFTGDVPLIESDGLPCVRVRIAGGPELLFGIDTGNANSTVDLKVAKAAGLQLTGVPPPAPPGFFLATLPDQHVGAATLASRRVLVFDFAENQIPTKIAGTLAYTALKDRILQVDYVAKRVRISDVLTGPVSLTEPRDRFSLITFGKNGPPIVVAHGFEVDGKPVTAQVDTMYTGSLLIYTASIGKLGLGSLAKTPDTRFFPFTDGGVNMKVAGVPSESFDGSRLKEAEPKVYFPTTGVHEPDGLFDATVGVAFFRGSILTLDFHGGAISVVRPDA